MNTRITTVEWKWRKKTMEVVENERLPRIRCTVIMAQENCPFNVLNNFAIYGRFIERFAKVN